LKFQTVLQNEERFETIKRVKGRKNRQRSGNLDCGERGIQKGDLGNWQNATGRKKIIAWGSECAYRRLGKSTSRKQVNQGFLKGFMKFWGKEKISHGVIEGSLFREGGWIVVISLEKKAKH